MNRRAKKEWRYIGMAPSGYINRVRKDGLKYIAFDEHEASIIKWAFEEISKGIFNTEQIFIKQRKEALNVTEIIFGD